MKNYLWHWKRLVAVFLIVIMMTPDISGIVAYANPDSGDTTEVETVTETVSETESEDEPEGEISESEEAESEGEPEGESESESQSESVNESEENESESVSESETDSVVETESVTETETMTETETETVMETTLEAEDDSNIRYIYGRELTEEEIAEMKAMEPKYLPELNMPKVPELAPGKNYLKSSNLPETYDARDEGVITSVKNQNPYGTCWSFGSISAMETSMVLRNFADVDDIDISERHLAYFSRHTGTDELGNADQDTIISSGTDFLYAGGNVYDFSMKMLNWHGGAKESDFPYSSVEEEISASLGQVSDAAHLKNAYILSTNANDVESRELLKGLIYKYKCVAASYGQYDQYFNYNTAAYYNDSYKSTNHLIAVVGWDDTYEKENFLSGKRPENDGAWIVKNSWGSEWGDCGYMYISYEDVSFASDVVMAVVANESDDYDNNYFYGNTTSWSFENGLSFAQIFKIKGNNADKELLRAVSIMNYTPGIQYSLQLYKNPAEVNGVVQNPESGTALLTTPLTGTITYAGVNQIELPEPITVEVDDVITVVLTSTNGDSMMLFTDTNYTENYFQHVNVSALGQSFRKSSISGGWADLHNSIESVKINLFTTDYSETVTTPEMTATVNSQPSGFGEPLEYLLKWKRCTGALSYDVLRAESEDGNYSVVASVGSSDRSYVDSVIEANWEKTFYYKIRANFTGGSSSESEVVQISAEVVLKPDMRGYEFDDENKVKISWRQFANADGYELQKKNSSGNFVTIKTLTDVSTTSYEEDYSAAELGGYEYRVRAYKGEMYSDWSDVETVYKDMIVSQVNPYTVKLEWYPRYAKYMTNLKCQTSYGDMTTTYTYTINGTLNNIEWDFSYYLDGFYVGNTCRFWAEVSPTSSEGYSYTTNKIDFYTVPAALELSGTYNKSSNTIELNWDGGVGADNIYIYRSESPDEDGELLTSVSTWDGVVNYIDDVSEFDSTTLYYTVYPGVENPSNGVVLGPASTYSVSIIQRKISAAVTLLQPENFNDTADYTISWTGCSDADSYKILRSTQENGEYSTIAEVQAGENSYVDSVSVSDWSTKYYYKVSALYEGEEPTVTNAVSVSELPTLACSTPSAVYDNNEIRLAWDAIAGADGYSIERRQKGAATFEVLTTTTTNSYVDDVTEENLVFYEYRIRAYKGTVYTEYSSIATAAKDLKGEAVSAYTTNLSWIKISNASKYKVYIVDEGQNYELGSYSWAEKVTVKTNSYINYKAGREYKYYIEAYDKNGVLLYTSSQISLATKPDALTMTASYVNDVLSISFANGLGAEQILVYRSVQENEEGNEIFATIDMNAEETIFTDSAFDYGVQKYYYHFYPATMLDNGTYVKGECLTYTLERKLETITGIKTATVAGENAIAITWDEWNGADSYTVYRSETTKDNYVTLAEGITEVSYKDTDVILGKTYYYKVLVNKNGLSSSLEDTKENFLQLIPSTPELYSAATGSEIIIRNNPSLEYALLKTESDALAEYGSGEEDVLDGENVLRFSILPNTRYYIYARTKTEVTGEAPVRCALPLVVNTPVKVELVISSDEFVITKGNQVSYTLTMKPDNIHYTDDVTWTAVDKNENAYLTETKNDSVYVKDNLGNSIIRITKNKIIAIGDSSEKEVYLTATKGSMNTNCHVIVNVPVTGLSWHVGEVNGEAPESTDIEALDNLKVGDVAKIGVNYQPENADDTTVYFSSSNSNILKVTSDSNNFVNLEAVSNGKCILSAYTADGVKISTLITVDVAGITYGVWISDTDIEGEIVTRDEAGKFVGENINNLPAYALDIKGESAPQSMQISAYLLNETSVTSTDENATVTGGTLVKAENGTDVIYASSNQSIAKIDIDGNITPLANGTVNIYAYDTKGNAAYGKCVVTVTGAEPAVKVKPTVYPIDKAYKLSAVTAAQSIERYSLNHNSGCELRIKDQYGNKNYVEKNPELFKFTSAKPNVCIVDEYGKVMPNPDYAGKKVTVKITAELLNDPAKRKVTFNVTVLDKEQISDIEMEIGTVDPVSGYVTDRKLTNDECISQKYEKNLSMTFAATAYNSSTDEMAKPSLKWSVSDTSIAKIKVNKDKTVTVTFKKPGRVNLICQGNDVWKTKRSVELTALSVKPVINAKQVTINRKIASTGGQYTSQSFTMLPLERSTLSTPEIASIKIGKKIYEAGSTEYEAFSVVRCEDGSYAVLMDEEYAISANKKTVYEVTMQTEVTELPDGYEEDSVTETFVMKVKFADKEPSLKITMPQINRIFVPDEKLRGLMVLKSSDVITNVRVLSLEEGQINKFDSYFTTEYDRGQWYIRFEDFEGSYTKTSIKGKIGITVKGYGEVIKTITVKTPVTKQKIAPKTTPSIQSGISDNAYVTLYNQTAKQNLNNYIIVGQPTSNHLNVVKEDDGRLRLSIKDGLKYKDGASLTATVKVMEVAENNEEENVWKEPVSVKVTVKAYVKKVPTVTMKKSTLTLNLQTAEEKTSTPFTLNYQNAKFLPSETWQLLSYNKSTKKYEEITEDLQWLSISMDESNNTLYVGIKEECTDKVDPGSYKFRMKGFVDDFTDIYKDFTVKIINAAPSVSIKTSGKLDLVNRQAISLKGKLTLKNITSEVTDVMVMNEDGTEANSYFTAKISGTNAFELKLTEEGMSADLYTSKMTLPIKVILKGGQTIDTSMSFKPTQSVPKIKVPAAQTIYKTSNELVKDYDLTAGMTVGTAIERIEIAGTPNGFSAIAKDGHVIVNLNDTGIKAGTYKVNVKIYFEGAQPIFGYPDGKSLSKTISVKVVQ